MEKKKKDCGTLIAVLLTGVVFGAIAGMVLLSLFYPVFQSDKWAACVDGQLSWELEGVKMGGF